MKQKSFLVLIASVYFLSCTKDSGTDSSTINAPYTLKYEVKCSSPINTVFQSSYNSVTIYTNGTGQSEMIYNAITSGTTWSKTITVTDNKKPFPVFFSSGGIGLT